jgi:hypothetical protein
MEQSLIEKLIVAQLGKIDLFPESFFAVFTIHVDCLLDPILSQLNLMQILTLYFYETLSYISLLSTPKSGTWCFLIGFAN